MYEIIYTLEAEGDLNLFRRFEQRLILDGIDEMLLYEPDVETKNRKRLRPDSITEWELRLGKFRVFYDVHAPARIVKVEAIGYKRGSRLFLHGEEYDL